MSPNADREIQRAPNRSSPGAGPIAGTGLPGRFPWIWAPQIWRTWGAMSGVGAQIAGTGAPRISVDVLDVLETRVLTRAV